MGNKINGTLTEEDRISKEKDIQRWANADDFNDPEAKETILAQLYQLKKAYDALLNENEKLTEALNKFKYPVP